MCKVRRNTRQIHLAHAQRREPTVLKSVRRTAPDRAGSKIPAEVYHIKAPGRKIAEAGRVSGRIEKARGEGLKVRANMYTYTRPGPDSMPASRRGRKTAVTKRCSNACAIGHAEKIKAEVRSTATKWENLYLGAGSPDNILSRPSSRTKLKPLTAKRSPKSPDARQDPIDTAMDLVAKNESRIGTILLHHVGREREKELKKPWISFGSDEAFPGAGAAVHEIESASARLRKFRACARLNIVATKKMLSLPESDPAMERQPAQNLESIIAAC